VSAVLALGAAGCTTAVADDPYGDGDASNVDGTGGTGANPENNPTVCVPGVPKTSQLPRLSRVQYDNTIRDLLGIESQPSSMLAPDTTGSVDQRAWDGYQLAAESLAAEVMANADAKARAIPCVPEGDGADCAAQLIEQLGRRAFRRPLTPEETARFTALYTDRAEITDAGTFEEAAELIIQALLLSPSFLMRGEVTEVPEGDYFALSNYEVASRLSYMLWSSMPDDALLEAAGSPTLWTPEQILEQAQRMLGDPKARTMVRAFHEHYLKMGPGTRWENVTRDPEKFPDFDESLVPLLTEETDLFVEHVVFDQGGTFQDLVESPVGFVNASLAPLYDLDPAGFGAELVPVELDATKRAGVFTRLGFLTSHALYDRSSPILRGAFLQKDVLCADIAAPPPGAEGTPLPITADLTTNRKRVDAQTSPADCATCHHTFINPAGFPLEAYDAIGAYQTHELFSGEALDTSASVMIGDSEVDVSGPVELSNAIAAAPEAQTCYARHWVQFAYERDINNEDSCTVDDLSEKLAAGGYTVLDLVADLTQSQSFRLRALETEEVAP
jgi:hypothetical protein